MKRKVTEPVPSPFQFLRGRGLRRRLTVAMENAKRLARIGNYWYWLHVPELDEGIDIAALICPLRYDVIVRRDFYQFYEANRDLYAADCAAFVSLATQTSYYTWYTASEVVRCSPYLQGKDDLLQSGFEDQIRRAVALYEDVMERGFDPKHPIVLRTAERLHPPTADRSAPPTGKVVSARIFMADGCHRLALLMNMGYTALPANFFRVQCFRDFSPFDSTSLLAQSLPIDPAAYFAFLSTYYCAPNSFEDRDLFLRWIEENRPEQMVEVETVIRVDGFGPAGTNEDGDGRALGSI